MLHYQLFWNVDTIICHKWLCHNKLFLILMWIFITNDDVDNENLDLHALPVLFWQYQPWTWWVKTRNFYSSNSNYHTCKIFTSTYMISEQAKTIELVRNRLPVSKTPLKPTWPSFCQKKVCDILSNNMKLMLINAETNAALNLQEETVFFNAAMYL